MINLAALLIVSILAAVVAVGTALAFVYLVIGVLWMVASFQRLIDGEAGDGG